MPLEVIKISERGRFTIAYVPETNFSDKDQLLSAAADGIGVAVELFTKLVKVVDGDEYNLYGKLQPDAHYRLYLGRETCRQTPSTSTKPQAKLMSTNQTKSNDSTAFTTADQVESSIHLQSELTPQPTKEEPVQSAAISRPPIPRPPRLRSKHHSTMELPCEDDVDDDLIRENAKLEDYTLETILKADDNGWKIFDLIRQGYDVDQDAARRTIMKRLIALVLMRHCAMQNKPTTTEATRYLTRIFAPYPQINIDIYGPPRGCLMEFVAHRRRKMAKSGAVQLRNYNYKSPITASANKRRRMEELDMRTGQFTHGMSEESDEVASSSASFKEEVEDDDFMKPTKIARDRSDSVPTLYKDVVPKDELPAPDYL